MIAVVQRAFSGRVTVGEEVVGEIGAGVVGVGGGDGGGGGGGVWGAGLVVLAAVHAEDQEADVAYVANKLVTMRIFTNGEKYFDLDVKQVNGSILLVSNFTVAGDTRSGRRPGLSAAAGTERGRELF